MLRSPSARTLDHEKGCRPPSNAKRDALAGRSGKGKSVPVPAGDEESRPSADAPSGLLLEPVSGQLLTFGPEDQARPDH
jgi:hypothetical protein